jgi:hypothetical protein
MSSSDSAVAENVAQPPSAQNDQVNNTQPQAPPRQSNWQLFQSVATRMIIMYFAMNAMSYFRGSANVKPDVTSDGKSSPSSASSSSVLSSGPQGNLFPKGTKFDMYVYLSESENFKNFNDSNALYWSLMNIEYGKWDGGDTNDGLFIYSNQFETTYNMQNNGSIYLHVYFTENGRSPNPSEKDTYSRRRTFSTFKRLNKYSKRVYKTTKNLLTGTTDKDEEYQLKAKENLVEILSFYHPNLTINLVDDHTPWQKGSVPPPLNEFVDFDAISGKYYPIVYLNDYWNLNSDFQPVNSTVPSLNLTLTFSHLQLWKWQLYVSQSVKNQWYGGMLQEDSSDDDQDTIKRTLIETNPYLLALTVIITLVHNVFEFLAFKNDIQFWRNRKSLEGLSVNSVLFGCVTSLIVFLYVVDNDTNTVVKISVGIGLLIELWKVPKVINLSLNYQNKYFGVIPRVVYSHKVVGYSIYSLIYGEHKGWYSWLLSMIYGFLLTFGFIMMTPQLFINYKLKSVAHLPWRMMTYKALNTFIDDIFAFVIKMPTMYRIGCFRDDIIFFIYLYQRYIYKIDKKRTNEFGTSGEDHEGVPLLSPDSEPAATQAIELSSHQKSE